MTLLLIAAGLAVLFWPSSKKDESIDFDLSTYELDPAPSASAVSFPDSISCVAKVRRRLEQNEELSSIELEAVDVLILALVRGSGK